MPEQAMSATPDALASRAALRTTHARAVLASTVQALRLVSAMCDTMWEHVSPVSNSRNRVQLMDDILAIISIRQQLAVVQTELASTAHAYDSTLAATKALIDVTEEPKP